MKEVLTKVNIALIKHYFDTDDDTYRFVINCGWCYHWAYVVYSLLGGTLCSVFLDDKLNHAIIKIDGMYYDSESNPNVGEDNFRDLYSMWIFNDRNPRRIPGELKIIEEVCVQDFLERWDFEPEISLIERLK